MRADISTQWPPASCACRFAPGFSEKVGTGPHSFAELADRYSKRTDLDLMHKTAGPLSLKQHIASREPSPGAVPSRLTFDWLGRADKALSSWPAT